MFVFEFFLRTENLKKNRSLLISLTTFKTLDYLQACFAFEIEIVQKHQKCFFATLAFPLVLNIAKFVKFEAFAQNFPVWRTKPNVLHRTQLTYKTLKSTFCAHEDANSFRLY